MSCFAWKIVNCRSTFRMRLQTSAVFWLHICVVRVDMVDTVKMGGIYNRHVKVRFLVGRGNIGTIRHPPSVSAKKSTIIRYRMDNFFMLNTVFASC